MQQKSQNDAYDSNSCNAHAKKLQDGGSVAGPWYRSDRPLLRIFLQFVIRDCQTDPDRIKRLVPVTAVAFKLLCIQLIAIRRLGFLDIIPGIRKIRVL